MDKIAEIKKCCISIENEMLHFENTLKEIIIKDKNFLFDDLNNFMFKNPKRLRVRFVFLFSKLLNINSPLVNDIALITELIHSASLIHDDIIDKDDLRRNFPTFYKKYGAKIAVLEGDFLLSLALEIISKTNIEISKIFSSRIKKTIQGEILQNEVINKIPDYKTYINKTLNKTGNLFLACLEALFSLGDFENELRENLINFIKNYSIAFQIKNDVDNFKSNISDIKNGNYTLPMIYFEQENQKKDIKNNKEKYLKKASNEVEKYKENALGFLDKIKNKDTALLKELSIITLRG